MPAPILHRTTIDPAWCDYNQHLNEAFYLHVFSQAGEDLLAALGLGPAERERHGVSTFTLETHLHYRAEVRAGEAVEVEMLVLDHDTKRMHLFETMRQLHDGALSATAEMVVLHVDMTARRAAPFRDEVQARLAALLTPAPWPERAGAVGLRRR